MSSLVIPVRSSLKPERSWDVPRPAGSRHRPGWFRKLLGGRWGNTMLQPGCCGCTVAASCDTCALGTAYPTIYVTDSYTTTALPFNGLSWVGCYQFPVTGPMMTPCDCRNNTTPTGSGSVRISYSVACPATSNHFQVSRSWSACAKVFGPCYYCTEPINTDCTVAGQSCAGVGGTYTCSGTYPADTPFADTNVSIPLSSCTPFPVSANLTIDFCSGSPGLSSPLAAGITLNI